MRSCVTALTACQAVHAIESFLSELGVWGAGVDGLISAFFDPENTSVNLRTALDRAGVEQVATPSHATVTADRRASG